LGCNRCGGEYVVGEGGSLECNRCGYVIGDISLLFMERPFDEASNRQKLEDNVPVETRDLT
jgi:hypothetical protein